MTTKKQYILAAETISRIYFEIAVESLMQSGLTRQQAEKYVRDKRDELLGIAVNADHDSTSQD